ncbi:MAG TPA: hypothetical protein VJ733_09740 [Candidatus Binatia bacterium]|nr:hypothetical protein [Candidatus Binatia bacterium]
MLRGSCLCGGVRYEIDGELTKERLKLTKDIPLSQLVDWSLVKEIK